MWKVLSTNELLNNRWIGVTKEKVLLPNGEIIDDFYKVRVSDASAVIAITSDNQIVLKSEHRHCYERDLIELPSGVFEPDETDALAVAKRELLEETGYASNNWFYLGESIENSAKLTNKIHLYLATDCVKVSDQQLDRTEDIEILAVPLAEAVEMVMSNRICCSCTAQGILKADRLLNGRK